MDKKVKNGLNNIEYEIRKILTDNDFHDSDNEQGKLWYHNIVSDIKGLCEKREDRAREETLNDFWTYFDEGKSELLELEDKGHMSLEEIEWDFGEERFKEYINKLTI